MLLSQNLKGAFLLLCLISCVIAHTNNSNKNPRYKIKNIYNKSGKIVKVVENNLIVKFKSVKEDNKIIAIIDNIIKLKTGKNIHNPQIKRVRKLGAIIFSAQVEEAGEIINELKKRKDVDYAEPNFIANIFSETNDTLYTEEWHLDKMEVDKAWEINKGDTNVIIGFLDTGVDTLHPDLQKNILSGYNIIIDSSGQLDDNGHGTLGAGIIGATTNNGIGISGILWDCKILPVKVLDFNGMGSYSDLAEGIIYAVDNGAKILNIGCGGFAESGLLLDAINYALNSNCIIVAAVGNYNITVPVYPAAYEGVIGVSATNQNDLKISSSNYGSYVDIAAPGTGIISTYLENT